MGYGIYTLSDGRQAGYAVEATCDEEGCTEKIDRGMGYLCGHSPGGDEWGCGNYYCSEHLFLTRIEDAPQMCERCADEAIKQADEED